MNKFTNIVNILTSKKHWYFDFIVIFAFSYLTAFIFIKSPLQFRANILVIVILCSYIFGYVIQVLNNVFNDKYYLPDWNSNIIKYVKQSGGWYLAYTINALIFYLIYLSVTFLIGITFHAINYIYFNSSEIASGNNIDMENFLFCLFVTSIVMPLTTIHFSKNLMINDAFKYKEVWLDFSSKIKFYIPDLILAFLSFISFVLLLKIKSINACFILATLPFIYLIVNLSFTLTNKKD